MNYEKNVKKWYSVSEYVDQETGEIITKNEFTKNYYKVKNTKKYEINGTNGTIKHCTECRKHGQERIKFD